MPNLLRRRFLNLFAAAAAAAPLSIDSAHGATTTGWRPIETAPKDGTRVILFCPEVPDPVQIGSYVMVDWYSSLGKPVDSFEAWTIGYGFSYQHIKPALWAPLLESPK